MTERIEQYDYDAGGNRIEATISERHTETANYSYYSNSSRLKSNGKYAYIYDDNGNLIKKGTSYTISGDSFTIDSEGEKYWQYGYDLLDRLISVRKNGDTVANYSYNHKGLRLKKENYESTIYYVFGINDTILYEQENDSFSEYIYVGRQHFARVDGELLSTETTTYYYHTDHLGSTVLVTNTSAEIVWSSEYTPFGSLTMEEGEFDFQKAKKFIGKDLDEDTGLYYYNARWYDAEIGRFTSADSYKGELENFQSLNRYIYTANNPLIYVDPTGNIVESVWDAASLGVDLWSFKSSIDDGDWLGACLDALGIVGDGISLAIPLLPGGYGNAIKAARLAQKAKRLTETADVAGGMREVYHGAQEGNALQVGLGGLQAGLGFKGLSDSTKIVNISSGIDELSGFKLDGGATFEGRLYRSIEGDYDPLNIHQGNIMSKYRYTGEGIGGLYFSTGEKIVNAELNHWGAFMEGRKMYKWNSKVNNFLDVSNPATRKNLAVNLQDITGDDYNITNWIGKYAKDNGYNGVIAPSARADGGLNIMLFEQSVDNSIMELIE